MPTCEPLKLLRSLSITLMLVVCWVTSVWAQSVEEGRSAYFAADFEHAFKIWNPLAENRSADAQYYLGILHSEGRGVLIDEVRAGKWFLQSASQVHPMAAIELGVLISNGVRILGATGSAEDWYQRAVEKLSDIEALANTGDPFAQRTLGGCRRERARRGVAITAQVRGFSPRIAQWSCAGTVTPTICCGAASVYPMP